MKNILLTLLALVSTSLFAVDTDRYIIGLQSGSVYEVCPEPLPNMSACNQITVGSGSSSQPYKAVIVIPQTAKPTFVSIVSVHTNATASSVPAKDFNFRRFTCSTFGGLNNAIFVQGMYQNSLSPSKDNGYDGYYCTVGQYVPESIK